MSDIEVSLYEQHPGFGEWGQRWAKERGFSTGLDGPNEIYRADFTLPARPVEGDHIVIDGDKYIVSYIIWYPHSLAEKCTVFAQWDGQRR